MNQPTVFGRSRAVGEACPFAVDLGRVIAHCRRPHHKVLTRAVGAESFRDFAHMLHTGLVIIDRDTTTSGFSDHLRWNQVYHRLAASIGGGRELRNTTLA